MFFLALILWNTPSLIKTMTIHANKPPCGRNLIVLIMMNSQERITSAHKLLPCPHVICGRENNPDGRPLRRFCGDCVCALQLMQKKIFRSRFALVTIMRGTTGPDEIPPSDTNCSGSTSLFTSSLNEEFTRWLIVVNRPGNISSASCVFWSPNSAFIDYSSSFNGG